MDKQVVFSQRFAQSSRELFKVLITVLWKGHTAPKNYGTSEFLPTMVEGMANKQLSTSVEETIEVKPMGGSSMGFYFSMTDKAWKSGDPKDYKYGTSGVLYVGNLMAIFTILTRAYPVVTHTHYI